MKIKIVWPNGSATALLLPSVAAEQIGAALPRTVSASTWGALIYFPMALDVAPSDDWPAVAEPGSVCYWREAKCLVFALGQTPISLDKECRLPTPMPVLGKISGDLQGLSQLGMAQKLRLSPG